jgi:hypothetical protein
LTEGSFSSQPEEDEAFSFPSSACSWAISEEDGAFSFPSSSCSRAVSEDSFLSSVLSFFFFCYKNQM